MAWIYLAESVESDSLSESGLEQSPIVSRTDTHKAFYCPECNRVTLIKHLSGMTLKPSEAICCQESTLSSEDSLARISVLPVLEKAWMESAVVFSLKSQDSLAKFDLTSFSWKMSQLSLFEDSTELQWNSLRSGMIADGQLFQPPQLEPTTAENDGSYWLTPRASDVASGEKQETFLKRMGDRTDRCAQSLAVQVNSPKTWPTPVARDYRAAGGEAI